MCDQNPAFTTGAFESIRADFERLVNEGALVICNSSGGIDSQALYLLLRDRVPRDQLVVIHADLGDRVEWEGVKSHIRDTIDGHPLHLAKAIYKDGSEKTLLNYIERRGMWPSSAARYCTSDLKRDPIAKVIRRIMDERGATVAINCMGIRADESSARAKALAWAPNKSLTNTKRTVFNCNPILSMTKPEAFAVVENAGQEPHWAYKSGMRRLSCCFCVLAGEKDLQRAGDLRPELAREYVELENRIGHTFRSGKSLAEIIGVTVEGGRETAEPVDSCI